MMTVYNGDKMIDEKFVMEILQSREDRRDKQLDLINRYKSSLISFTLNTPGIVKDNEMYRDIHRVGFSEVKDLLIQNNINILYQEVMNKSTGSEGFVAVDFNPLELKVKLIDLEEKHLLGRIFDIDVFNHHHNQITRRELELNPRKCLLCDREARICGKEKKHSYEELYEEIEFLWEEYRLVFDTQ